MLKEKPLTPDEIRDQQKAIDDWYRKKRNRWLKRQNLIHKIKNFFRW